VGLSLPPEELTVNVDPMLLRQALVNLLDNAIEATPGAGSVVLRAEVDDLDLRLVVEDTGGGLPTDDFELLTQPFYSTKGRGSGMGLALVHRIVTDHGGALSFARREPRGTQVRLVLPKAVLGPAAAR
jgi:signal transduction histidine kinase